MQPVTITHHRGKAQRSATLLFKRAACDPFQKIDVPENAGIITAQQDDFPGKVGKQPTGAFSPDDTMSAEP